MVWTPFDCRYASAEESFNILSRTTRDRKTRVVYYWGDSNSRRVLKYINSRGRWCHRDPEDSACVCEDNGPKNKYQYQFTQLGHMNISFTFTGGLVSNSLSMRVIKMAKTQRPDLLILSLGNWDAAYITLELFTERLKESIEVIKRKFGDDLPVLWRSVNFFCCGIAGTRLLTEKKNIVFELTARRMLARAFVNLQVWDVAALYMGMPYEQESARVSRCPTNHVRSEYVALEAQILMHMLVNYP